MAVPYGETLAALAVRFTESAVENRISSEVALRPDIAGMRIYGAPIIAVASANDPLFEILRAPGVIGPHFLPPTAWLEGARSVISFFLPFSGRVTEANRADRNAPALEWLHGCTDGKAMVRALAEYLADELRRAGFRALVPGAAESLFREKEAKSTASPPEEQGEMRHSGNWSERHVAFVCGLGTFGLSAGLITRKGIAGSFGSVITERVLEPDARPYSGHMEYCARCGECARRCPAGAISMERGKDHTLCKAQSNLGGRYGCGKCQVGVPCQTGIPDSA